MGAPQRLLFKSRICFWILFGVCELNVNHLHTPLAQTKANLADDDMVKGLLFAQAWVDCDNKIQEIGLNHDQNMIVKSYPMNICILH